MSNKIIGSEALIKKVENASPFDTSIHVNLEAIRELPEMFSAKLVSVKFDPKKLEDNFTSLSGKWYPKPHLLYKIAEARGVYGDKDSEVKDIYEYVNVNPLYMKDDLEPEVLRKKHVAVSTTKTALVVEDDGTILPGAPCTNIDTFWNDCLKAWAVEEEETNGYDPSIVKEGKFTVNFGKKKVEMHGKYIVKTGQYGEYNVPLKYDNKFKRKRHYEESKSMAINMTQTKSWEKAIREKAGLVTAFETKDLMSGELIFSKIVKSSESIKMEKIAHLERISKGIPDQNQSLLFGDQKEPVKNVSPEPEPEVKKVLVPTTTDQAISIINDNINNANVPDDLKQKSENICKWLQANHNAEQSEHWADILHTVKVLQESVS